MVRRKVSQESVDPPESVVVTILGKQWELCWRKRLPSVGRGRICHGECDAPDTPGKQIRIRAGLSDAEHLDVLIHEMLHAAAWHIREDLVDQFATDVSAVLVRLGWKRS